MDEASPTAGRVSWLILPAITVHAVLGLAIVAWLILVVPGFIRTFEDFELDLPASTRLLFTLSEFCVRYWYALVPLAAAVDIGAILLLGQVRGTSAWLFWAWCVGWLIVGVVFWAFGALAISIPMNGLTQALQ